MPRDEHDESVPTVPFLRIHTTIPLRHIYSYKHLCVAKHSRIRLPLLLDHCHRLAEMRSMTAPTRTLPSRTALPKTALRRGFRRCVVASAAGEEKGRACVHMPRIHVTSSSLYSICVGIFRPGRQFSVSQHQPLLGSAFCT